MSHELKEGVKLKSVAGPTGPDGDHILMCIGDNPYQCKAITVVEQPGQMSMVPWAKAEQNNGSTLLINLALMESVTLLNESAE